jgi:hypothetical protein
MERPMASYKVSGAEEAAATLKFNVTRIVSEEVFVCRELGLIQVLRLKGVIPDDIGYRGLAGKPVMATLWGGEEFPARSEIDKKHGVTEGASIGEMGLDGRRGMFVHAYLLTTMVQAIAMVAHRALSLGGGPQMVASYASSSIERARKSRPNDLRRSTEKRAALLELSIETWVDDD